MISLRGVDYLGIRQRNRDLSPSLVEGSGRNKPLLGVHFKDEEDVTSGGGAKEPSISEKVSNLVANLQSVDRGIRYTAAQKLGIMKKEASASIPALILALEDKDQTVRYCAAVAIGEMGSDAVSAVPGLVKAMGDKDNCVRAQSAGALAKIGKEIPDIVKPALVKALKSESLYIREEAAETLVSMGEEDAGGLIVPTLLEGLKRYDLHIGASVSLTKIGKKNPGVIVPMLIDAFKDCSGYPFGIEYTLAQIGNVAHNVVEAALMDALKDENSRVQVGAAAALVRIVDNNIVVPVLVNGLKSKDPNAQYTAAIVFKNIKNLNRDSLDLAIPALIEALSPDNSDRGVRYVAATALGGFGKEACSAISVLIETLQKDKDDDVRTAAARALGVLGDREMVLPLLIEALKSKNSDVLKSVAFTLGAMKTEASSALPALHKILENKEETKYDDPLGTYLVLSQTISIIEGKTDNYSLP